MIKRILLLSMILLGYASYSYSQPVYLTAVNLNGMAGIGGAWIYNSQPSGDLTVQSTVQMPPDSKYWDVYGISVYNGYAYMVADPSISNDNIYLYKIDPQTGDLTYESMVLDHGGPTEEIISVAFNNGYAYVSSSDLEKHFIDKVKYYAVNSDGTFTYQGQVTNESDPNWAVSNITFNGDYAFIAASYGPNNLYNGKIWQYQVNSNGDLTNTGHVLPPPLNTGKSWDPILVVFGSATYYQIGRYNGRTSIWLQDGSEIPMPSGVEKWLPHSMIIINGYAYVADAVDAPSNSGHLWQYSINESNGHLTYVGQVSNPAGIDGWNITGLSTAN